MANTVLQGKFFQVVKYAWGEVNLKIKGDSTDYRTVMSLENPDTNPRERRFYEKVLTALKESGEPEKLARLERIASPVQRWKRIKEEHGLTGHYDEANRTAAGVA